MFKCTHILMKHMLFRGNLSLTTVLSLPSECLSLYESII